MMRVQSGLPTMESSVAGLEENVMEFVLWFL